MKKLVYFMAAVAVLAMSLTSCKKDKKDEPKQEAASAIELKVDVATFDDYYEDYGDYIIALYNDAAEVPYIAFDVLPSKASFVGSFSTADETIDLSYTSLYLDAEAEESLEISSAKISISEIGGEFLIEGEMVAEGKTYKVKYTGAIEEAAFIYESDEVVTKNVEFDEIVSAEFDEEYGELTIYLGEDYDCGLVFELDGIDSATILPVGEYPINYSYEPGSCLASSGYGFFGPNEAYYYTVDAAGEYIDEIWFIVAGKVTVSKVGDDGAVKIAVAGTSKKGSSINISYTGKIELEAATAPAKAPARRAARK